MKKIQVLIRVAVAILGMMANAKAQSWLTNGLVAYYPFHGNFNDASGNGNNATNNGATFTSDRFSVTNGALMFNGFNNYVSATVASQPLGNAARTLTCWLKPADARSLGGIVAQGQGNCTGHLFGIGTWGGSTPRQLMFWGGCRDWQTSLSMPTNQWSFVAMTYDGAGNLSAYVNGSNQSTANGTLQTLSAHFWMGGETGNDGQSFDYYYYGAMDDVRMYNRALSTNEVAQLYAYESTSTQFTQNLTNMYATNGQNLAIGVSASSPWPLQYEWHFIPATGVTGQAGAVAQTTNDFVYGVVVTNGGFGYGSIPNVSFIGGNGSGAAGYATVSNGVVTGVTVTNAGTGYSSLPRVAIDPPNGWLVGQTNSSLVITNVSTNSVGTYYVVVSAGGQSVTSSVGSLTLVYPPGIVMSPSGFSGIYHSSNSLAVYASGTSPLTYQWFLNGTNISAATNSIFGIASLNPTNTGAYTVEVINQYGMAFSAPAYVYLIPTLTSPFTGAVGVWGQSTALGVGAIGSGTLSYQWYFNGVAIPGATGSNYVFDAVQFTNAGLYSVVVSSAYGSVTNAAYQVVVNPANVAVGICPMIYINGTAGYGYTIQSTVDLANTNGWTTVTNITLPTSSYIWADTTTDTTQPSNPHKFYRVVPNQ